MCGIFGWATTSSRALDRETLVRLTDILQHRGPDSAGYRIETVDGGRWQVALGHRRLAIIDLSPGGAQPMSDADDRLLIFNGEIYNYIELREELKQHQVQFATNPLRARTV